MKSWPLAGTCLALLGLACSDARLVDNSSERAPKIRVLPEAFIGSVPCEPGAAGALQGYVARLFWVSDDFGIDAGATGAVQLSPFVPCNQAVIFPAITGRQYAADIRGFDRVLEADELDTAPGRWTATCGRGSSDAPLDGGIDPYGPVEALSGLTVPMRGCTTFEPLSGPAALIVDVESALGELSCGSGAGKVGFLRARLGSNIAHALCGDPLSVASETPYRFETIELSAFEVSPEADAGDAGSVVPDASVAPGSGVDAGPDAGDAAVSDAGDAGTDSGLGLPPPAGMPSDAGDLDAGAPAQPWQGTLRWRTRCVGRTFPGVSGVAVCEPLQAL